MYKQEVIKQGKKRYMQLKPSKVIMDDEVYVTIDYYGNIDKVGIINELTLIDIKKTEYIVQFIQGNYSQYIIKHIGDVLSSPHRVNIELTNEEKIVKYIKKLRNIAFKTYQDIMTGKFRHPQYTGSDY